MLGLHRRKAGTLTRGALVALVSVALTAPPAAAAPSVPRAVADGNGSLVMVLDSSGSMAEDDGSGSTRIESARRAVGTVVDALPDGYPTGLRVYGADRSSGCTDTRLVRPVEPLDRAAMKRAVEKVEPRGDTPIGLALRKAAEDLPEVPEGSWGRRTILLVSDGEDTCGAPEPCEVAGELAGQGVDLRIDAIGFQVRGKAREQLECIARAGHGSYYDAPDADALARQLQRASRLSADGYRLKGEQVTGGRTAEDAPDLTPGQYVDTIGPGEQRWYATGLGDSAADDFAVTAVPQPGVPVASLDGLHARLVRADRYRSTCDSAWQHFGQSAGAMPITAAVSRIPSAEGGRGCDEDGRYLLVVERRSQKDSDQARWPVELLFSSERPLKEGTVPAQSETEYGRGGKDASLPTDSPRDIRGGTGFNDARRIGGGVWRDELLPAQTRWYRVPVGWGQQLRYDVEFGNEPTVEDSAGVLAYVRTEAHSPTRVPIRSSSEFGTSSPYRGEPAAVSNGTVPTAWTNRWESRAHVVPVRRAGDYYIGVSLDPNAARLAENVAIGVVLRVAVLGEAKAGPQHGAPTVQRTGDGGGGERERAAETSRGGGAGGAGWSGPVVAAVAGGAGAALLAVLAVLYARSRRRTAAVPGPGAGTGTGPGGGDTNGTTRGGTW